MVQVILLLGAAAGQLTNGNDQRTDAVRVVAPELHNIMVGASGGAHGS